MASSPQAVKQKIQEDCMKKQQIDAVKDCVLFQQQLEKKKSEEINVALVPKQLYNMLLTEKEEVKATNN